MTNWGFSEANYDLDINYGCVFYKLVLTALPDCYAQSSIYAHFPLVIPEENRIILTKLKNASLYNFDLLTGSLVQDAQAHRAVTGVSDSPLLENAPGLHLSLKLFESEGLSEAAAAFYKDIVHKLLQTESYELAVDNMLTLCGMFSMLLMHSRLASLSPTQI